MKDFGSALWGYLVLGVFVCLGLVQSGCSEQYGQSTPDDTIATAKLMVEKGDAKRLPQLIYAENEQMRKLLNRFGVLLGNVQKLGNSIEEAFPGEVTEMKEAAKKAAAEGKATSLLGVAAKQMGGMARPTRMSAKQRKDMEEEVNAGIKALFADPYGFLAESEGRLTHVPVTDSTVALMWDGKMIMPPLGMVMKKADDGKWYLVLPTNLPGISQFMPRTEKEYKLWGSIIATLDNVVKDLTNDIKTRQVSSLEGVATKAGEKALIPMAMTFAAYGTYMEAKKREAKQAAAAKPPAPVVEGTNAASPGAPSTDSRETPEKAK